MLAVELMKNLGSVLELGS